MQRWDDDRILPDSRPDKSCRVLLGVPDCPGRPWCLRGDLDGSPWNPWCRASLESHRGSPLGSRGSRGPVHLEAASTSPSTPLPPSRAAAARLHRHLRHLQHHLRVGRDDAGGHTILPPPPPDRRSRFEATEPCLLPSQPIFLWPPAPVAPRGAPPHHNQRLSLPELSQPDSSASTARFRLRVPPWTTCDSRFERSAYLHRYCRKCEECRWLYVLLMARMVR